MAEVGLEREGCVPLSRSRHGTSSHLARFRGYRCKYIWSWTGGQMNSWRSEATDQVEFAE